MTTAALTTWSVLALLSLWRWLPISVAVNGRYGRRVTVAGLALFGAGTLTVAVLASMGPPLTGPSRWLVAGVAMISALITGGTVARGVLELADAATTPPATAAPGAVRVQKTVLRGGAWIGALERLALTAALLVHWPEGIAIIIAIKGLARYPELRVGQGTGAAERFIIGTFASLCWAAACAGIGLLLIGGP